MRIPIGHRVRSFDGAGGLLTRAAPVVGAVTILAWRQIDAARALAVVGIAVVAAVLMMTSRPPHLWGDAASRGAIGRAGTTRLGTRGFTAPASYWRDPQGVRIFVSYRGEDEPFGAVLVDHALSAWFGPTAVFRASRSIAAGDDFVEALLTAVRTCSALLVVIGPRWLAASNSNGQPRISDPADWVHREIAEAFRHQVRVIPVLLNANMPPAANLPEDIAALARCQYHRVHYRNSQYDIDHLAEKLAALVPDLTPQLPAEVSHNHWVRA